MKKRKPKLSKVRVRTVTDRPKNTRFPGRPHYEGPRDGVFAFLHHAVLCEYSSAVMDRVRHVRGFKPKDEKRIRLRDMMYLGAKLTKAAVAIDGKPSEGTGYSSASIRRRALALVQRYNPKHHWDGDAMHGTLVKADGSYMTG